MSINSSYRFPGFCPACRNNVTFIAENEWFRDYLLCPECPGGSIPRERAVAAVLHAKRPNWRLLTIHESSPANRGISKIVSSECTNYTPTHFFPQHRNGTIINGYRNENLEEQTFPDNSFDLVLSLDVMEHVNRPEKVLQEVTRTLKPQGLYIFTTPTYKDQLTTSRRAEYLKDGGVEYFAEPEYHGNPVDPNGSLVTFHYGYDFPHLIFDWSGLNVEVARWHSPRLGIIGEFTEVYCCTKS